MALDGHKKRGDIMNIIEVNVFFEKGFCNVKGIPLIVGDYNSTEMIFNFDKTDGEITLTMLDPDKKNVFYGEVVDSKLDLYTIDPSDLNKKSPFQTAGVYTCQLVKKTSDSKLTVLEFYLEIYDSITHLDNMSNFFEKEDEVYYRDKECFYTSNRSIVCPFEKEENIITFNLILPKKMNLIRQIEPFELDVKIGNKIMDLLDSGIVDVYEITDNMLQISIILNENITIEDVSNLKLFCVGLQFFTEWNLKYYPNTKCTVHNPLEISVNYFFKRIASKVRYYENSSIIEPEETHTMYLTEGIFRLLLSADGYKDTFVELEITADDIKNGNELKFPDIQLEALEDNSGEGVE